METPLYTPKQTPATGNSGARVTAAAATATQLPERRGRGERERKDMSIKCVELYARGWRRRTTCERRHKQKKHSRGVCGSADDDLEASFGACTVFTGQWVSGGIYTAAGSRKEGEGRRNSTTE